MNTISDRITRLKRPPVLARTAATAQRLVYALSWTAYTPLVWRLLLRMVLLLTIYSIALWLLRIKGPNLLANVGVFVTLALAITWTVYDIACLRAIHLVIDQQGVWLHAGVFPWNSGINGLRWDEIGMATYRQSLLSWACKSYGVSVGSRYTRNEALYLGQVKHGDDAVQCINRLLAVRANAC